MATIKLKINDKVLEKVLWLLGHFTKDEVEIIPEDSDFSTNKNAIEKEIQLMDAGDAKFLSKEELNDRIDQIIGKVSI